MGGIQLGCRGVGGGIQLGCRGVGGGGVSLAVEVLGGGGGIQLGCISVVGVFSLAIEVLGVFSLAVEVLEWGIQLGCRGVGGGGGSAWL